MWFDRKLKKCGVEMLSAFTNTMKKLIICEKNKKYRRVGKV